MQVCRRGGWSPDLQSEPFTRNTSGVGLMILECKDAQVAPCMKPAASVQSGSSRMDG